VSAVSYEQLALSWSPESKSNKQFKLITAVVIIVMLLMGIIISLIPVPEEKRVARHVVPERIAKFIIEKKKPEPKITKPKPKPKPKLKPPKPKVKKLPEKKKPQKPLTKTQEKARVKAAESGLLALGNELADLMDTSDVSSMVGGKVKSSSTTAAKAGSFNKSLLIADAGKGSGGVNAGEYSTQVGKTQLSQREITLVKQSLLSADAQAKASNAQRRNKSRSGGIRGEEDITIVFDQNKSKLYSIYNRARRKNPNLKGKIVLEITIAPSGKVSRIRVVSSELNDPKLESRLLSRIKQFNFGAKKVEQVTVTYPIEFLPS
jgi:TonB family protein